MLDEELKFFRKFNLHGTHYSLLYEGKNIEILDLEKQYHKL